MAQHAVILKGIGLAGNACCKLQSNRLKKKKKETAKKEV